MPQGDVVPLSKATAGNSRREFREEPANRGNEDLNSAAWCLLHVVFINLDLNIWTNK
jgi:hypothetical protein